MKTSFAEKWKRLKAEQDSLLEKTLGHPLKSCFNIKWFKSYEITPQLIEDVKADELRFNNLPESVPMWERGRKYIVQMQSVDGTVEHVLPASALDKYTIATPIKTNIHHNYAPDKTRTLTEGRVMVGMFGAG